MARSRVNRPLIGKRSRASPPRWLSPPLAAARPRRPGCVPPPAAPTWQNVNITAGGFVDGLVYSDAQPGLAYARTDIGGAYRWDAAAGKLGAAARLHRLQRLERARRRVRSRRTRTTRARSGSRPASTPSPGRHRRTARSSAPATRAAHGSPATCRSSWPPTRTAATWASGSPSTPSDDNVLYLASPANGLWKSADGGATWAQVASFPVDQHPRRHRPVVRHVRHGRRPPRPAEQDDLRRRRDGQRRSTSPPTRARPGSRSPAARRAWNRSTARWPQTAPSTSTTPTSQAPTG